MKTTFKTYLELHSSHEYGIYRRVDSKEEKTEIWVFEGYVPGEKPGDPLTLSQYKDGYWPDGDDRFFQNQNDEEHAPYITYEKIDELENLSKYLA